MMTVIEERRRCARLCCVRCWHYIPLNFYETGVPYGSLYAETGWLHKMADDEYERCRADHLYTDEDKKLNSEFLKQCNKDGL